MFRSQPSHRQEWDDQLEESRRARILKARLELTAKIERGEAIPDDLLRRCAAVLEANSANPGFDTEEPRRLPITLEWSTEETFPLGQLGSLPA